MKIERSSTMLPPSYQPDRALLLCTICRLFISSWAQSLFMASGNVFNFRLWISMPLDNLSRYRNLNIETRTFGKVLSWTRSYGALAAQAQVPLVGDRGPGTLKLQCDEVAARSGIKNAVDRGPGRDAHWRLYAVVGQAWAASRMASKHGRTGSG